MDNKKLLLLSCLALWSDASEHPDLHSGLDSQVSPKVFNIASCDWSALNARARSLDPELFERPGWLYGDAQFNIRIAMKDRDHYCEKPRKVGKFI